MTQREFRNSRKGTRARALAAFHAIAGGEDDDLADAKAPRTLLQYESVWSVYCRWCEETGLTPMPATSAQVRDFIRHLVKFGRSPATIDAYVGALMTIARYHGCPIDRAGLVEPLKAARRRGGPPRRARPLRAGELQGLIANLDPASLRDVRDGALLLLAWGAALRSAELSGLDWQRSGGSAAGGTGIVMIEPAGTLIRLLNSKAAQLTEVELPVPDQDLPPLREWLTRWIGLAGIGPGEPILRPVTRHGTIVAARLAGEAVTAIVRRRMFQHLVAGGMSEHEARLAAGQFSSHSMRRGYVTAASNAGMSLAVIRRRSRHGSDATLGKYIAASEDWKTSGLGGLWEVSE